MSRRSASLRATLEAHGFTLTGMGGNCSAYVRAARDGFEECVTLEGEPLAPSRLSDRCLLSTGYPEDGQVTEEYITGRAIVTALTHPSQEYALLSLRIANLVKAGA